jgi:hypothetical protein
MAGDGTLDRKAQGGSKKGRFRMQALPLAQPLPCAASP